MILRFRRFSQIKKRSQNVAGGRGAGVLSVCEYAECLFGYFEDSGVAVGAGDDAEG